jgi:ATP-dependent DNA helicase PIF1
MQLISKCSWWPIAHKLKLTINERIRRHASSIEDINDFSNFLMSVGNGEVPIHRDLGAYMIQIPDEFVFQSDKLEDFINWCYPNIANDPDVADKAILTPLNKDADIINHIALNKMSGPVSNHKSIDSVTSDEAGDAMQYPVEYLNTLTMSGMPVHNLELKIGCPLILLRNLNPLAGLCNGTRLKLIAFTMHVLQVTILNGSHAGQQACIPRIDLVNADNVLPFQMTRRQFPVRLAFAMTINKAQGQSLSQVGVYLPNPVFSHGQLYVALSRAATKSKTKVFICTVKGVQGKFPTKNGVFTKNIVYAEALSNT